MPKEHLSDWLTAVAILDLADLPEVWPILKARVALVNMSADSQQTLKEAQLLLTIHSKLRYHEFEKEFWRSVIPILASPLPVVVSLDLIDRGICIVTLGHTMQPPEVQRRLEQLSEDAKLLGALRAYEDRNVSVDDFTRLIEGLVDNPVALISVAHGKPSNWDKLDALRAVAESNVLISKVVDRELHVQRQIHLASQETITPDEVAEFLSFEEPRVYLKLASNPGVPMEVLNKLLNIRGGKLARRIRDAARREVEKREQVYPNDPGSYD